MSDIPLPQPGDLPPPKPPEVQHPEHLMDQLIRLCIQDLGLKVPETGMDFDDGFTYTAFVALPGEHGRQIKLTTQWAFIDDDET